MRAHAHRRPKRTQCGSGATRRRALKGREFGGIRRENIVARAEDFFRFVRVRSLRTPAKSDVERDERIYVAYTRISRNRARETGKRGEKRERRFATSRFPDTSRPIAREMPPTRLRVSLLTYASHVDRSSRLLVQRIENISATLTCAAITTAAILDSPFPRSPRIRRARERRRTAKVGATVSPSRGVSTSTSPGRSMDKCLIQKNVLPSEICTIRWSISDKGDIYMYIKHIRNFLFREILMALRFKYQNLYNSLSIIRILLFFEKNELSLNKEAYILIRIHIYILLYILIYFLYIIYINLISIIHVNYITHILRLCYTYYIYM